MIMSRNQICHDLALIYARIKTTGLKGEDHIMRDVEEADQLLVYYTYAYTQLYENYLKILQKHEDRKRLIKE